MVEDVTVNFLDLPQDVMQITGCFVIPVFQPPRVLANRLHQCQRRFGLLSSCNSPCNRMTSCSDALSLAWNCRSRDLRLAARSCPTASLPSRICPGTGLSKRAQPEAARPAPVAGHTSERRSGPSTRSQTSGPSGHGQAPPLPRR